MVFFNVKYLADGVTVIEDCAAVRMYLVEGRDSAVLIDTGAGYGDLKGVVAGITDKPVKVLLTHGHCDHAGGASAFEDVYLCAEDFAAAEEFGWEVRYDFVKTMCTKYGDPAEIKPENILKDNRSHPYHELLDGQEFELGGRTITAISMPGHTRGSHVFYDSLTRSMFLGDACNPSTYLFLDESVSVKEYAETVRRLSEWKVRVSRFYGAHDYGFIREELPARCIDEVYDCCLKVLAGEDDAEPFYCGLSSTYEEMQLCSANKLDADFMRMDGKIGNIIYRKTAE